MTQDDLAHYIGLAKDQRDPMLSPSATVAVIIYNSRENPGENCRLHRSYCRIDRPETMVQLVTLRKPSRDLHETGTKTAVKLVGSSGHLAELSV